MIKGKKGNCVMFVWLWTDAWLGTAALSFGSARDRTGHPPDWCVFMPVPGAGVHTFAIPRSTSGGRGAEDGIKGRLCANFQHAQEIVAPVGKGSLMMVFI